MTRRVLGAGAALGLTLLAGQTVFPQQAGAPSFTVYVALGDSLVAGFSNGSLVESHQRSSIPALVGRQGGAADFQQPIVSQPGIPPELVLVSLAPGPVITPKASTSGTPTNAALGRPYNNLAVPGATVVNLLTTTTDVGGFHDLILRGLGTALDQAVGLRPTFVTLWTGNNDVLGAVIRGRAVDGETLTPTDIFRAAYTAVVARLKTTGARIVAANLPDVTTIPFATTIPPYVVNPSTGQPVLVNGQTVPLLGGRGPLPPGTLVTLAASSLLAQGIGIPTSLGGTGTPLPNEVILDAGEIAIIQDHVRVNNQSIAQICQAASIPVVDANALLNELATTGRDVGGVRVTSSFLTGGAFGLDGVHPSELGYALMTNEFIRVIDENGGQLEPVSLAPYLGVGAARASSERAAWFEFTAEAYEGLLRVFPEIEK